MNGKDLPSSSGDRDSLSGALPDDDLLFGSDVAVTHVDVDDDDDPASGPSSAAHNHPNTGAASRLRAGLRSQSIDPSAHAAHGHQHPGILTQPHTHVHPPSLTSAPSVNNSSAPNLRRIMTAENGGDLRSRLRGAAATTPVNPPVNPAHPPTASSAANPAARGLGSGAGIAAAMQRRPSVLNRTLHAPVSLESDHALAGVNPLRTPEGLISPSDATGEKKPLYRRTSLAPATSVTSVPALPVGNSGVPAPHVHNHDHAPLAAKEVFKAPFQPAKSGVGSRLGLSLSSSLPPSLLANQSGSRGPTPKSHQNATPNNGGRSSRPTSKPTSKSGSPNQPGTGMSPSQTFSARGGELERDSPMGQRFQTELHIAAANGASLTAIQNIVAAHPELVGVQDDHGRLPLHYAAAFVGEREGEAERAVARAAKQEAEAVSNPAAPAVKKDSKKEEESKDSPRAAEAKSELLMKKVSRTLFDSDDEASVGSASTAETTDVKGNDEPWSENDAVLQFLLSSNPETAKTMDSAGKKSVDYFITHCALPSLPTLIKLWRALIAQTGYAHLKEEYLLGFAITNQASLEVIEGLTVRYPMAVKEEDLFGKLPLHYAAASISAFTGASLFPSHSGATKGKSSLSLSAASTPSQVVSNSFVQSPGQSSVVTAGGKTVTNNFNVVRRDSEIVTDAKELLDKDPQLKDAVKDDGERKSLAVQVISLLINKYPRAVTRGDREGRLPLHYACASAAFGSFLSFQTHSHEHFNVADMLEKHPNNDSLAKCQNPFLACCAALLHASPHTSHTRDKDGKLPLHYLATLPKEGKIATNLLSLIQVLDLLLTSYPDGVVTLDNRGFLPLHQALRTRAPRDVVLKLIPASVALISPNLNAAPLEEGTLRATQVTLPVASNGSVSHTPGRVQSLPSQPIGGDESADVSTASTLPQAELQTLLHYALVHTADEEVLQTLLDAQPNLASIRHKETYSLPLHTALSQHSRPVSVIERLLECYPSAVKERDGRGRLPLHLAFVNLARSLGLLRERERERDFSPNSARDREADKENVKRDVEIVRRILSLAPSVLRESDSEGQTPLALYLSLLSQKEGETEREALGVLHDVVLSMVDLPSAEGKSDVEPMPKNFFDKRRGEMQNSFMFMGRYRVMVSSSNHANGANIISTESVLHYSHALGGSVSICALDESGATAIPVVLKFVRSDRVFDKEVALRRRMGQIDNQAVRDEKLALIDLLETWDSRISRRFETEREKLAVRLPLTPEIKENSNSSELVFMGGEQSASERERQAWQGGAACAQLTLYSFCLVFPRALTSLDRVLYLAEKLREREQAHFSAPFVSQVDIDEKREVESFSLSRALSLLCPTALFANYKLSKESDRVLTRRWAKELNSAISTLHNRYSMVHGDLTLSNMLITPSNPPSLIISDLGSACEERKGNLYGEVTLCKLNSAILPPELFTGLTDAECARYAKHFLLSEQEKEEEEEQKKMREVLNEINGEQSNQKWEGDAASHPILRSARAAAEQTEKQLKEKDTTKKSATTVEWEKHREEEKSEIRKREAAIEAERMAVSAWLWENKLRPIPILQGAQWATVCAFRSLAVIGGSPGAGNSKPETLSSQIVEENSAPAVDLDQPLSQTQTTSRVVTQNVKTAQIQTQITVRMTQGLADSLPFKPVEAHRQLDCWSLGLALFALFTMSSSSLYGPLSVVRNRDDLVGDSFSLAYSNVWEKLLQMRAYQSDLLLNHRLSSCPALTTGERGALTKLLQPDPANRETDLNVIEVLLTKKDDAEAEAARVKQKQESMAHAVVSPQRLLIALARRAQQKDRSLQWDRLQQPNSKAIKRLGQEGDTERESDSDGDHSAISSHPSSGGSQLSAELDFTAVYPRNNRRISQRLSISQTPDTPLPDTINPIAAKSTAKIPPKKISPLQPEPVESKSTPSAFEQLIGKLKTGNLIEDKCTKEEFEKLTLTERIAIDLLVDVSECVYFKNQHNVRWCLNWTEFLRVCGETNWESGSKSPNPQSSDRAPSDVSSTPEIMLSGRDFLAAAEKLNGLSLQRRSKAALSTLVTVPQWKVLLDAKDSDAHASSSPSKIPFDSSSR